MAIETVTQYPGPEPRHEHRVGKPQAGTGALSSPAPDGVDDAERTAALDHAIHVLFPPFPAR
jgi:hypothetical protein